MPLPLFLLTLLAGTMQMTQKRARREGPLPGLREQGSVDSLLHRCLLSGGEHGVRWINQEKGSHLNGFTFVKTSAGHKWPEKGNTPTLRAPATLLHSSLSFCLLFPCPLWSGLAISSPSEPCLPVLVHAQDNPSSPAHIQKHRVYSSSARSAVLN